MKGEATAKSLLIRLALSLALVPFLFSGCHTPNNPYRSGDAGKNIFYTTFTEPPKHLDPAKAYSSDEYDLIGQIYEPLLQYHYLKRPYELIPLTAEKVPMPLYIGKDGGRLSPEAPQEKIWKVIYEIRIRKGIMYAPHPAFARESNGVPAYSKVTGKDLPGVEGVKDFPIKGSRELKAGDYMLEVMRLADPVIESPILPILEKYILGLSEYSALLRKDLEEIRRERKRARGPAYNQTVDERENPIALDYGKHRMPGIEKVDDYTFRIILKAKYPQFVYWLAMPFFSPVPAEALEFYSQGALADRNITIDRFPVGTGPYMMDVYNPNMEIILARNTAFHVEPYPEDGEGGGDGGGRTRNLLPCDLRVSVVILLHIWIS